MMLISLIYIIKRVASLIGNPALTNRLECCFSVFDSLTNYYNYKSNIDRVGLIN